MICKWCKDHNVDPPKPVWDEIHYDRVTDACLYAFLTLQALPSRAKKSCKRPLPVSKAKPRVPNALHRGGRSDSPFADYKVSGGLVRRGHPSSMDDAASALFKLCLAYENKARTVREGAVQVILGKIVDKVMVDELVSLLALLAKHSKAVEALVSHGAVPYLLNIVKETTSERVKKNCIGILCTVCCNHREKRSEIRENEMAY
uniref:U-box domain-containing protein 9 n=1 Tax=Cajanus cajan TaxID=3821 RepID=A0A151U5L8_CAJCA|nr:U-box domain-containing protein 9 [Cajanus cajan]